MGVPVLPPSLLMPTGAEIKDYPEVWYRSGNSRVTIRDFI